MFKGFERRLQSKSFGLYCLGAGLVSLIGSTALIGIVLGIARLLDIDIQWPDSTDKISLADLFGTVLFAPMIETVLLIAILNLFGHLGLGFNASCVSSALMWGIAHGFLQPVRFFGSILSFLVFSFGYFLWRSQSRNKAFLAALTPHMFVNTIGMVIVHLASP